MMKFKMWVEIVLILLVITLTFTMFFVPEVVGCLLCLLSIIIFMFIDTYGTIIDKLDKKIRGKDNESN